MNYAELIDLFKKRLNRRDVTQTLVETFIAGSIQRAQRLLRTPGSEVGTTITFGAGDKVIAIPGDYLKGISITVDDGTELKKGSLSEALAASRNVGVPYVYARNRDVWVIGPRPNPGAEINIVYHANFATLQNPTDSNWLTEIAPDIIIDGALAEACIHFTDPRKDTFEGKFLTSIVDLNTQAQDDELAGAVVSSGLDFDD